MTITFDLPAEILERLREQGPDVNAVAKEYLLVELYRRDIITQYELSQTLGLHRLEIDGVLKRHNVTEDLPTNEELAADFENMRRLLDEEKQNRPG
jgi:hypothetical protein